MKRTWSGKSSMIVAAVIVWINLMLPLQVHGSSGGIELDGDFGDWVGLPSISDGSGEGEPSQDLVQLKWLPDTEEGYLYLYCERADGTVDKKNNPKAVDWDFQMEFTTGTSRLTANIHYHPESRQVDVDLLDSRGRQQWGGKGKWGEGKESANRIEFYVPLTYIAGSLETGFQFNMRYLGSSDTAPDSGAITISTASTFPWITAIPLLLWVALLVLLHRLKLNFFRFITGSAGLFVFVMLFASSFSERLLEGAVTWCLWVFSQMTGGFSVVLGNSLVTVLHGAQAVSYIIDYECSGFIELLVFVSLLLFYPLFKGWKRILLALLGSLFIFAANLVRLVFITYSIRLFGTPVFFVSHTVLARILFFGLMVVLYYFVFTKPHIRKQKVGDLSYD